ncbi:MAG: hypothetical protein ABSC06_25190 [Rhodopila sp.]
MRSKHSAPGPVLLACTLALSLGGCVAAPLAQMAVTQMVPAQPACTPGSSCPTNAVADSVGEISKGVTASFRKLIGSAPDQLTAASAAPTK